MRLLHFESRKMRHRDVITTCMSIETIAALLLSNHVACLFACAGPLVKGMLQPLSLSPIGTELDAFQMHVLWEIERSQITSELFLCNSISLELSSSPRLLPARRLPWAANLHQGKRQPCPLGSLWTRKCPGLPTWTGPRPTGCSKFIPEAISHTLVPAPIRSLASIGHHHRLP